MIDAIIYDIDCVVLDWYGGLAEWIAPQPQFASYKVESKYDLLKIFDRNPDHGGLKIPRELVEAFARSDIYANLPFEEEAIETIDHFHGKKRQFVLSSCGDEAVGVRRAYLEEHLPGRIEAMEFQTASSKVDKHETLLAMCKKYGLDPQNTAFFDDMLHNIRAGVEIGFVVVYKRLGIMNLDLPAEYRGVVSEASDMREFRKLVEYYDLRGGLSNGRARTILHEIERLRS